MKCLRLTELLGIAFTGSASLIRSVLAGIYGDPSIEKMDELRVGELLEKRDVEGNPTIDAIEKQLNDCVPTLMEDVKGTQAQDDLSIFLAGKHPKSGRPHVIYWCASTDDWKGKPFPVQREAIRTLPPECEAGRDSFRHLTDEVNDILNNIRFAPAIRIKNAISHLAKQEHVVSVNSEWILRSLKRGFIRL